MRCGEGQFKDSLNVVPGGKMNEQFPWDDNEEELNELSEMEAKLRDAALDEAFGDGYRQGYEAGCKFMVATQNALVKRKALLQRLADTGTDNG